ncbi:MAG: 3-deoxy-7-phosphoheptulonate synthase, partial [Gammaproteobacteria bacterium]
MYETEDLRIASIDAVAAPEQVRGELSITERSAETVHDTRQAVHRILHGQDERLVCVVGPCSIHDPKAAREYGERLLSLRQALIDRLEIVMRVYFEKPRTTVGWKGLINDPDLDGSFHINKGLHLARKVLLDVTRLGLPAASEFLDTTFGQYYAELVSLGAIGARTVESQI